MGEFDGIEDRFGGRAGVWRSRWISGVDGIVETCGI